MLPESTVGIPWSSKKHPLHKIIAPMDIYPYKKKHLYTSNLWNIILNQLSIKILTLNIRWHYLDKNHIDLWLLSMYIQMQKNKWQLNGLRYKSITCYFGGYFWPLSPNWSFFPKIRIYHENLISWELSKISYELLYRKKSHMIMSTYMFNIA